MSEKPPLITIGITSYNVSDTMGRALESAFAQDWPRKEIVIVDDCSTDNGVAVIEALTENRPGVKLVKHTVNRGIGAARNTIVENSSGEFIAFFDDDDESIPSRLTTQYERIRVFEEETGKNLIACYASGHRQYGNGYKLPLRAVGSQPEEPCGPDFAAYLLYYKKIFQWFYGSGTPACSLMARKSTFEGVGNFDPEFRRLEDIDFAVRLALAGGCFIASACSPFRFTSADLSGETVEC